MLMAKDTFLSQVSGQTDPPFSPETSKPTQNNGLDRFTLLVRNAKNR
jgi:hypothetical protein